ncbi:MAG: phosphoribosylanthranilate isomerase [Acidobacteria bacterium]|nr:phosphoribosylanthranilate isomerase [Acidobacteriota bacterium]
MIKVCGITNIEDASAAVEDGVDAVGFNFFPGSKRYVTPEKAAMIALALPAGVLKAGVFVNERAETVQEIARVCGLDVAQLHGDERPEDAPKGVRIWKAFRVEAGFRLEAAMVSFPEAEALLLDGPAGGEFGGAGIPFLWRVALGAPRKVVLAGGLDGRNVQAAIAAARPWGVDACSKLESSPGIKDRGKMREFISAARAAVVETA